MLGSAELGDRDRLGVVDDDLARVEKNLEPVGADQVVGAGGEGAGGAVAEVDQRGHFVFDGDVALEPEGQLGEHRLGHPAQPLPQIELVRGLVDQHAAPLAAPGGAPGALVVVALRTPPRGDDPARVPQLAQLAALNQVAQVDVERVGALVEHHRGGAVAGLSGVIEQRAGLRGVHTDRLLDQHVQAGVEGVDAHLGVQVVRNGGDHRVHLAAGQHVVVIGEERYAEALGGFALGLVGVADGGELNVGHPTPAQEAGVVAALSAEADDSHADGAIGH